ncbi:MAG: hypothetical protein ACXAB2_03310 [Candidatus Hodarchaeales archaeon]
MNTKKMTFLTLAVIFITIFGLISTSTTVGNQFQLITDNLNANKSENDLLTLSQENETFDPITMRYSTYFGGTEDENWPYLANDSNGDLIFVSSTQSDDFPSLLPIQDNRTSEDNTDDLTISKFSSEMGLRYSTYYGGNDTEIPYGVEVDSENNIVIAGVTRSVDFPTLNAYNDQKNNDTDVDLFVLKIAPDGQTVLFSTYVCGLSPWWGVGLALDASDNIILTGQTNSSNFPVVNAYQENNKSWVDGFIMKMNADGQSLLFSTYIGGNDTDLIFACDIDSNGDIIFGGHTASDDFPLVNSVNSNKSIDFWDIVIGKMSSDGQSILFSTLLGGSIGWDIGIDVVVDSKDDIIVAGATTSNNFSLINAYQDTYGGDDIDAFLAKINSSTYTLEFSTFLGGEDYDVISGLAVDTNDNIIYAGATFSYDFPITSNAYDDSNIFWDGIFGILNSDGQSMSLVSVIGAGDHELISDVLVFTSSEQLEIMFAGITTSMDFPTFDALRGTKPNMNEWDNFITKFTMDIETTTTTSDSTPNIGLVISLISLFTLLLLRKSDSQKR